MFSSDESAFVNSGLSVGSASSSSTCRSICRRCCNLRQPLPLAPSHPRLFLLLLLAKWALGARLSERTWTMSVPPAVAGGSLYCCNLASEGLTHPLRRWY